MEKVHYSRSEYRNEYLRSEHWKQFRVLILARDPICRICEKRKSADPHHLSYDRLHNELEDDVIGICRTCHNYIHAHKELCRINNLHKLKDLINLSRKPILIDPLRLSRLVHARRNNRLLIAGILKIPASFL